MKTAILLIGFILIIILFILERRRYKKQMNEFVKWMTYNYSRKRHLSSHKLFQEFLEEKRNNK